MNKLLTLILSVFVLASCSPKKGVHYQNKQIEKNANKQTSGNYTNYTVATYIQRFKGIAITEMNRYGIPASITMAQAILESGIGKSDLAKYANNHFGIKCTSDWPGKGYYKDDDKKDDCFRVYKNPEESFRDHSEFLKRKRYAFLFELDKNDYIGWAKGLKQAGYATNPKYPDLLISLIERYELDQFDRPEGKYEKIKREDKVLADINKNIPKEANKDREKNATAIIAGDNYVVQKGDTLYNISKRFGLTVEELKALNNMTDDYIQIGQGLKVKK
ncbi:MAG TPA: glucosaminidase domain-containing protein [Pelobium sp.]|nr:glucosaminidase domain-containing protein [Pelobium sp.]